MALQKTQPHNLIIQIQDKHIHLKNVTAEMAKLLVNLNATEELMGDECIFILPIVPSNKDNTGKILMELRDNGALFSGSAHGWPPSEIFCEMREQGFVGGTISEVIYTGPGLWKKYTR